MFFFHRVFLRQLVIYLRFHKLITAKWRSKIS